MRISEGSIARRQRIASGDQTDPTVFARNKEERVRTWTESFNSLWPGRRFALMGFDDVEGDSILAALGTVRGIGHVVGAAPNIPGLNSFSPFDACFINASATTLASSRRRSK